MSPRPVFTDADLEAIRAAVAAAERRSAGEIVTTVVERCDQYQGALWKGAALGALAAALVASVLHGALGLWGGSIWLWLALPAWAGAGVGYLLPAVAPALHRALIGAEVLDLRVERRAAVAFLENGVGTTRGRTGVLVLVALFEHRVEILRDSGVERRVPAAAWPPIIDRLAGGLRQGRAAQSMLAAIGDIGALLEASGVTGPGADIDELPDEPSAHRE
ncbi:MAG TPA: TPM domain-containing protein [Thermoanaerobaculia bacterium]|nr:TPM domain-containing protein [Thermoanaerobaculia bacterium]